MGRVRVTLHEENCMVVYFSIVLVLLGFHFNPPLKSWRPDQALEDSRPLQVALQVQ